MAGWRYFQEDFGKQYYLNWLHGLPLSFATFFVLAAANRAKYSNVSQGTVADQALAQA